MNMDKVVSSYREKLEELSRTHEQQMQEMQLALEGMVREADEQIKAAIEESHSVSEEKKPDEDGEGEKRSPAAVWIVAADGEHLLVLNQEAAVMQIALLDRLAEVLEELKKLAPKRF